MFLWQDLTKLLAELVTIDSSSEQGLLRLKLLQERAAAMLATVPASQPDPPSPAPTTASSVSHAGSPIESVDTAMSAPARLRRSTDVHLGVLISEPLCSTRAGAVSPVDPVDWKTERALSEKGVLPIFTLACNRHGDCQDLDCGALAGVVSGC